jgi:hypothetical protein
MSGASSTYEKDDDDDEKTLYESIIKTAFRDDIWLENAELGAVSHPR